MRVKNTEHIDLPTVHMNHTSFYKLGQEGCDEGSRDQRVGRSERNRKRDEGLKTFPTMVKSHRAVHYSE